MDTACCKQSHFFLSKIWLMNLLPLKMEINLKPQTHLGASYLHLLELIQNSIANLQIYQFLTVQQKSGEAL